MKWLSALGLSLTLVGASLLYVFAVPQKTVGNVILFGSLAVQVNPDVDEKSLTPEEWQPVANRILDRCKLWSRVGFGCVAIGSLLQLIATLYW